MKYVIGNQKNYLDRMGVIDFIEKYKGFNTNCKVIVAPSSIFFGLFEKTTFKLCGQNVSYDSNNPYTGEINASQLKSMGVNYCIVGHSERRKTFNESNEVINLKISELLKQSIIPILCIGEDRIEKENDLTEEVLYGEIINSLNNINFKDSEIIIAYEPVWAISDGIHPSTIPSNDEIELVALYIKKLVKDKFNLTAIVLYGGSVNPKNIDMLNQVQSIDGYLIGGASKKADEFLQIIEKCV